MSRPLEKRFVRVHHDEKVDIAIGSCVASRMAAEQNDPQRMKLLYEPLFDLLDELIGIFVRRHA
jgi:hypothetical protein